MRFSIIEESILEIAKKLIKKGPLHIEELYSESIQRLKYSKDKNENERKINEAIYQLIVKKVIIRGTKITKDTVLSNETRKEIFEFIDKNPGSHLREIRETLNLYPQQAAWHLKMLKKFDFIRKNKIKNKITYYNSKIDSKYDEGIDILKNKVNFKILENILLFPGSKLKNLAKKTKISSGKVKNIISILKEFNFIYTENDKKKPQYYANLKHIMPILEILSVSQSRINEYEECKLRALGKLKIKQEFEFIGRNIKFKVHVLNNMKNLITKINLMLFSSAQYKIDKQIQEIDIMFPGESREVVFNLTPLYAGRSKVFGVISYVDAFEDQHSENIRSEGIKINWPLEPSEDIKELEIEK